MAKNNAKNQIPASPMGQEGGAEGMPMTPNR